MAFALLGLIVLVALGAIMLRSRSDNNDDDDDNRPGGPRRIRIPVRTNGGPR